MKFKKNTNKKMLSFVMILTLLFSQTIGLFSKEVKAQEVNEINVLVNGFQEVIVEGTSTSTNALDALTEVLEKSKKSVVTKDSQYGGVYISEIDGLAEKNFGGFDGWMYIINRDGEYITPMTSIDTTSLVKGDKLIVYYGSWGITNVANKIEYSTYEPNADLTITLNNEYEDWTTGEPKKKIQPISNVLVKIDGKEYELNENKIRIKNGLSAGKHTIELSGWQKDSAPNVVYDEIEFELIPKAYMRVEGLNDTIVEGNVQGRNAFEMLQNLLKKNNIDMKAEGNYVTSIDGIASGKFGGYDGWMYYAKSSSEIISPQVGMDQYIPTKGENIIVYYTDFNVPYVNKINFTPGIVKPNESFKIQFLYDYFDWNDNKQKQMPIKDAVVEIDDLAPLTTNENGEITIQSYILDKGTHSYVISGYQKDNLSKVVMDKGTFKIDGINSPTMDYTDASYDSKVKVIDNSNIEKNIAQQLKETSAYMKNNVDPWAAVSLKKLGIEFNKEFIGEMASNVKNYGVEDLYNTDIEKYIIALTASGYTPYNFMGYNFVEELLNRDISKFYTNDIIFGLLAYNYVGINENYKITEKQLVDLLLKNKLSYDIAGNKIEGWTYYGNNIDPDLTGAALCALAPYMETSEDVKTTVENVVKALSYLQNESGYIPGPYGISSESLSMVICGLLSIGIDPEGQQFTKDKGDLVSALLSFKGTDGQFKHSIDGQNNKISTEQALRALISLNEYKGKGKYNYYDNKLDKTNLVIYNKQIELDKGENEIITAIHDLSQGEKAIITVGNKTIVNPEVFSAIKGHDKNIIFQGENIVWEFNGKDIKQTTVLDLSLEETPKEVKEAITNKVNNYDVLTMTFKYDGKLPGKAQIKIKLDESWLQGKDRNNVYMYYYNPQTNKVEEKYGPYKVDEDGWVQVELEHCSDYFFSDKELIKEGVLPATGAIIDNTMLLFVGMFIFAMGLVTLTYKKMKNF